MEPKILYEDGEILVIDKPSGLVVNRAESVKEKTVQDWAEKYLRVAQAQRVARVPRARDTLGTLDSRDTFLQRSGIVHRIDKETSGCLIIAKTPEAFIELQRQFHDREIEKTYISLVHGQFEMKSGIVKAEVGRLPWNRERFGVLSGGRPSETVYNVLENIVYEKEKYSLVEWHPKTGRTHQIRVHAKYLNHPLVSDSFYAGRKTSRRDREWCPRLFLHAVKITFTHPDTGNRITVESPLPKDLKQVLEKLKS